MLTHRERKTLLKTLWGAIWFLPFAAGPFAVMFVEVRTHLQVYAIDYEMSRLSQQLRELDQQREDLQEEEDRQKTLARIEAAAPNLGLVPPEPSQVVTVHVPRSLEPDVPYRVADLPAMQEDGLGPAKEAP